jgi:hypothetical protein
VNFKIRHFVVSFHNFSQGSEITSMSTNERRPLNIPNVRPTGKRANDKRWVFPFKTGRKVTAPTSGRQRNTAHNKVFTSGDARLVGVGWPDGKGVEKNLR